MNPLAGFVAGVRVVPAAFGLLRTPGIRPYVVWPLIVNAVVFSVGTVALGEYYAHWLASVAGDWPAWLRALAWLVFGAFGLLLVFFGFSVLANVFASPFNGLLVAAVERHESGRAPAAGGAVAMTAETLRSLVAELRKALYVTLRAVPLVVLTVIPGLNVIAPPLWFLFGVWTFALQYLDCPCSHHGRHFPAVIATMELDRGAALGFGLAMLVVTVVPIVNFVAVPVGVIAATRLYRTRLAGAYPE